MFEDDHQDLIKSLQSPVLDAQVHLNELSSGRIAERLSQSTFDTRAVLSQAELASTAKACRAAAALSEVIDQYRHSWRDAASSLSEMARHKASGLNELIGNNLTKHLVQDSFDVKATLGRRAELDSAAVKAAQRMASLNDVAEQYRTSLRDTISSASLSEIAGLRPCDIAALAGYQINALPLPEMAGYKASDIASLSASVNVLDHMQSHFQQIRDTASALRPMETLSASLYEQFGSTLTARNLQQELGLHAWSAAAAGWQRDFQDVVTLASGAMGYAAQDIEEEMDDAESDGDVSALDDESSDAPRLEAYVLATRFISPSYELLIRLLSLASRIDPAAIGTVPSWDRMILAIASAHRHYAPELARIAFPLLQRLDWLHAPAGPTVRETVETLSMNDAEEFEELVDAMNKLLRRIENSMTE